MQMPGSMYSSVGAPHVSFAVSRRHRRLLIVEGMALVLLGLAAVAVPIFATLALELFFGSLLLLSGIVGAATTLINGRSTGFAWSLISAVVAITAGVMLLRWPLSGAMSLTMILSVFLLLKGFASIMFSLEHRRVRSRSWQFMLASGAIDLALAVMIIMGLPGTSLWAIGLLLGINMIFGGCALLAMGARVHGGAARSVMLAS